MARRVKAAGVPKSEPPGYRGLFRGCCNYKNKSPLALRGLLLWSRRADSAPRALDSVNNRIYYHKSFRSERHQSRIVCAVCALVVTCIKTFLRHAVNSAVAPSSHQSYSVLSPTPRCAKVVHSCLPPPGILWRTSMPCSFSERGVIKPKHTAIAERGKAAVFGRQGEIDGTFSVVVIAAGGRNTMISITCSVRGYTLKDFC